MCMQGLCLYGADVSSHSGIIHVPNQMQLTGAQKKGNYIIVLCNDAGITFFAEDHGEPNSNHI